MTRWSNAAQNYWNFIIIVLTVVSIFIMMTVIGFKVSQKRDEIEIMKLLSATNWYIRWPFMLEGILYGVAGTVVGWIIASAGFYIFHHILNLFYQVFLFFPYRLFFWWGFC